MSVPDYQMMMTNKAESRTLYLEAAPFGDLERIAILNDAIAYLTTIRDARLDAQADPAA